MNKITRIFAIVMAIAMVFGLTACGGNTDAPETTNAPTEAPTTEMPTESIVDCDALGGHAWVDASCDVAKTCSVCGDTEGKALGHVWSDATYEAPKTCETCGATEGEALVSYFAEHGLDARLCDTANEYELSLQCGADASKNTVAKITVEDYKTVASDETHAAANGYEWKILTLKMHFSDENAQIHGIAGWNYLWDDFYIGEASDADEDTTGLFENGMAYPINWNGIDYADGLLHIAETVGTWEQDEDGNNYLDIIVTVSVRVPVGYNGVVFGLETTNWSWADGACLHEIITDNTLLFCMD